MNTEVLEYLLQHHLYDPTARFDIEFARWSPVTTDQDSSPGVRSSSFVLSL